MRVFFLTCGAVVVAYPVERILCRFDFMDGQWRQMSVQGGDDVQWAKLWAEGPPQ